jgi:hypothetical protein
MGLHLNASQLRIAVALRLGCTVSQQHVCICGAAADQHGTHALSCRHTISRHSRHSSVNAVIKRALHTAGFPSTLEPCGLSRADGSRPDGLTLIPWMRGRCLIWDTTCVHRLAASYSSAAASPGAKVAEMAEARKCVKHAALSTDYQFQPVALELLGGVGPSSRQFLRRLGSLMATQTFNSSEGVFLRQRLGIAVQVGNAACVLECIAAGRSVTD